MKAPSAPRAAVTGSAGAVGTAANPLHLVPAWSGPRSPGSHRPVSVIETNAGGAEFHVAHPYHGVPRRYWRERALELHDTLPVADDELVETVVTEIEEVTRWFTAGQQFGRHSAGLGEIGAFATPIHNNIAKGIGQLAGFRYGDPCRPSLEKDVICTVSPAHSLEVKCIRDRYSIIGNRSSTVRRRPGARPAKAQDSFYLAVSWEQPIIATATAPRIHRISIGYLSPEDFSGPPRTADGGRGRGQRALVPFDHDKMVPIYITPEQFDRDQSRRQRAALAGRRRAAPPPVSPRARSPR